MAYVSHFKMITFTMAISHKILIFLMMTAVIIFFTRERGKTVWAAGKVMASVFWDARGIIIIFIDYLEKG
jgi:hypothetical protein